MKMMTLAACALVASAVFAQEEEQERLKEIASDPQVQAKLDEPTGAYSRRLKDGSRAYFAKGSATYSFGTAKDIRNKTRVAELDAKKRLVNYIEGSILKSHDTTQTESTEQSTTSTDGKNLKVLASHQEVEILHKVVEEYTNGRLIGVLTLEVEKIPNENLPSTGEICVTVGMSKKSIDAANEAHKMVHDAVKSRTMSDSGTSDNGSAEASETQNVPSQKREVRKLRTADIEF